MILSALLPLLFVLSAPGDGSEGTDTGPTWGADYFPNVELITQDGERVRFFDDLIEGKVVVVNFIYTSCPDACPLETAKMGEVYRLLEDRIGKDVFMYSISIDPVRDTPEVLKEYTERFQTGPGWLFLTGEEDDIRLVRKKMGMLRADEQSLEDHSLSLLIGNQATDKWMKRSPMENPYLLATQIGTWLHGYKTPPKPGLEYKDAPTLREISRGENLYRTRCVTCHLIGPDDGIQRQGPNLLGVMERRERAWLARWLAEPDVMLAEKDPIALELYENNRNLPMPNMRLNSIEVESLLGYMETESKRVQEEIDAQESWALDEPVREEDADYWGDEEERGPAACCEKDDLLLVGDEPSERLEAARVARPTPRALTNPSRVRRIRAGEDTSARGAFLAIATSTTLCLGLALALGLLSFGASERLFQD